MRSLLKAVAQEGVGADKVFYGTREEIDAWLKDKFDPPEISVTVTDINGVTVGKKPRRYYEIDWGLRLPE